MTIFSVTKFTWSLFSTLSLPWRLHQTLRCLMCPFHKLLQYLPEKGKLLDLGCGHGLFLALAHRVRPQLKLSGIDLSKSKIESAQTVLSATNVPVDQLEVMDVMEFPAESVDAISMIDVLYLVPWEKWEDILRQCYNCLSPGGVLIFKEVDKTRFFRFMLLYLQEVLAVRVLKLTKGNQFTFTNPEDVVCLLEGIGFRVKKIPLYRWHYFPHYLWLCTK